jgi:hypothetical protein
LLLFELNTLNEYRRFCLLCRKISQNGKDFNLIVCSEILEDDVHYFYSESECFVKFKNHDEVFCEIQE